MNVATARKNVRLSRKAVGLLADQMTRCTNMQGQVLVGLRHAFSSSAVLMSAPVEETDGSPEILASMSEVLRACDFVELHINPLEETLAEAMSVVDDFRHGIIALKEGGAASGDIENREFSRIVEEHSRVFSADGVAATTQLRERLSNVLDVAEGSWDGFLLAMSSLHEAVARVNPELAERIA